MQLYLQQRLLPLLVVPCYLSSSAFCFHSLSHSKPRSQGTFSLPSISVPAAEIDKDLSSEEKTVVGVVRKNGPSVAFVTSVWPRRDTRRRQRRQHRRERGVDSAKKDGEDDSIAEDLPMGQSLGSGSAFVVDSEGYLVTNFHVIERAFMLQDMESKLKELLERFAGNVTQITGIPEDTISSSVQGLLNSRSNQRPLPGVFVRINSLTQYQKCAIVGVDPSLDVAVLKIVAPRTNELFPAEFGSSEKLLVGQSLVAIGNPFGLDNTVTTGVVSALDRDLRTNSGSNSIVPIRKCIQTDCSINPGNSGGPLLNLRGKVVGVNTAIVSTSGSSAGIGFAVPSDQIQPVVERIIRGDKIRNSRIPQAWLGVSIVRCNGGNSTLSEKNWVSCVEKDSPAELAGIRPLRIVARDASVQYGDAIVAIGGNKVSNFADIQKELETRVPSENVQVTLENRSGDRRVVYLTLQPRV